MTVLVEHFDLEARADRQLPLFEARYNIAPTQDVLVVREADGMREASMMRWGLIPSWSKEPGGGPPMINARAETLAEKPAFRTAFRRRRCIIPADGFYEWKQSPGGAKGKKQPYYIRRPDGEPFGFAGLWEGWSGPPPKSSLDGGAPSPARLLATSPGGRGDVVESCTIVTTAANRALAELHDRMPVILAPNDYALWLDSKVGEPEKLQYLLAHCGEEELVVEPVSTHVNRVANEGPQCVAVERSLFE
jgi:putative SOS response-associated peptidase YedK